jgi:hypothetical protein
VAAPALRRLDPRSNGDSTRRDHLCLASPQEHRPPVGLHRPNSDYEVVLWEVTLRALGRDLTSLTLKDRPVWVLSGKGAATPQGKYDDVTGKGADAWMLGLTPSV